MAIEILIVDDNADIRNILNELIIDAGYKTRVAANYNQALSEIDKKIPDVAILDVKLDKGDNDGIQLLSHIKSKNKDIPVIIIDFHEDLSLVSHHLELDDPYSYMYEIEFPDSKDLLKEVKSFMEP